MTGNQTAMVSRSEMMLGKGVEQGYCAAIGDRHRSRPARSIGELETCNQRLVTTGLRVRSLALSSAMEDVIEVESLGATHPE